MHNLNPRNKLKAKNTVSMHLESISALLSGSCLNGNDVENFYKTHFAIKIDSGRVLGFSSDTEVKYADVVKDGERFTVLLSLSRIRDSCIKLLFLVLWNKKRKSIYKEHLIRFHEWHTGEV